MKLQAFLLASAAAIQNPRALIAIPWRCDPAAPNLLQREELGNIYNSKPTDTQGAGHEGGRDDTSSAYACRTSRILTPVQVNTDHHSLDSIQML